MSPSVQILHTSYLVHTFIAWRSRTINSILVAPVPHSDERTVALTSE